MSSTLRGKYSWKHLKNVLLNINTLLDVAQINLKSNLDNVSQIIDRSFVNVKIA